MSHNHFPEDEGTQVSLDALLRKEAKRLAEENGVQVHTDSLKDMVRFAIQSAVDPKTGARALVNAVNAQAEKLTGNTFETLEIANAIRESQAKDQGYGYGLAA